MIHSIKKQPKVKTPGLHHLIAGTLEQCQEHAPNATREALIDAHRHCERNAKGNKSRKESIARALRKIIKANP